MTAIEVLKQAIADSGLSSSAYAREILVRDPRSLRRWLAGHSPIPQSVCQFLKREIEPGEGEPEAECVEEIGVSE